MGQGADPTTVMLDQMMRVFLMEGMRAAVWVAVMGLAWVVIKKFLGK